MESVPCNDRCFDSPRRFDKAFMPKFEHQKGPQRFAMISHASFMFVQQASDVVRLKQTRPLYPLAGQKISRERIEFFLQPFRDWNSKAFFTTPRDKRR